MKKESSITRDIKLQAESLHRRLDALSKQVQKTEEQQGPAAATTRIQRCQQAALQSKFQQVDNILDINWTKKKKHSGVNNDIDLK